jgi:hypothetical protein
MATLTIPVLRGTIARRILINYRADPAVIQSILPPPFRPRLHRGHAIVGVCLIRLERVRPAASPLPCGISSENAAHRIAVEWDEENGGPRDGVFIPRRDTDSVLNHLTGGRLFPGQHHLACFEVRSDGDNLDFQMRSHDAKVEVRLRGSIGCDFPANSCFASLQEASDFFASGSLGYSVRHGSNGLDGLILKTKTWHVEALDATKVYSSFYDDTSRFPRGSVVFDHVLIMRNIEHEWHAAPELVSGGN